MLVLYLILYMNAFKIKEKKIVFKINCLDSFLCQLYLKCTDTVF